MTRFLVARGTLRTGTVAAGMAMLCGCAQQPTVDVFDRQGTPAPVSRTARAVPVDPMTRGFDAARTGDWATAQAAFGAALRDDLRNPHLQFLNGLAYDQLSRRGERAKLDLARVGYESALKFDPGSYWAYLQLGYLNLDTGDYVTAQQAFASAVKDQPRRWEAVYGLGVASYYSGDATMTRLAAERALQLAPDEPLVARLHAFALAATGDPAARTEAEKLAAVMTDGAVVARRVNEVLQAVQYSNSPESSPTGDSRETPGTAAPGAPNPQVVVDVTIILSSQVQNEFRGINLFDGLSFQYGYGNQYSANRPSGGEWSSNRSITSNIGIPQLTYSLNLFNNSGQMYQVLARPSLTAYLGRESEFFAGRTISVGVSGVNLGQVQPIDIGVGLKVTPEAIDGNKVTFKVHASRSFLSREQVGSFQESLTTFKQLVQATAEVEFGQTLLLSALSEKVRDATYSKTPGLGDIPGASVLFNDRNSLSRTESMLVMVTPVRPTTFASEERLPPAAVEHLRKAWRTWIDPSSSVDEVLRRLESQRFFRQAEHGDLKWGSVMTPALLDEALRENVQLAAR